MFTFSQMVDEMVSETKRPDLVSEISRYLNQTIRELHFNPERNSAIFYRDNLNETLLTATAESGETWDIPNPTTYQKLLTVKYPGVYDSNGDPVWAEETSPGRHLNHLTHYYYRVGGTFVFSGYGGINATIALAWFEFPRSLKYKAPAARPASYDEESGWTFADGVDTPELEEAAKILVTNWLLLRWKDVIAEGVRAKVYKRLEATERARTCYSLYGALRQGLWTSETAELI